MAGEAVIGALRVIIGADSASLDKGLADARKGVSTFSSEIERAGSTISSAMTRIAGSLGVDIGPMTKSFSAANDNLVKLGTSAEKIGFLAGAAIAGLAVAAVAAGAAIAKGLGHAIDRAEELNAASQKFGVPVEQLSALKYAAEQSEVSFESLGVGLKRLSVNMSEVAGGAKNDAAKAFEALNVKLTDSSGNLRKNTEILGELADKFSVMERGAAKTALAVAVFGKSGADLIPLLNEGSAGIKSMTDEAAKAGQVISTETALASDKFNDNLAALGKTVSGFSNQLLPHVITGLVTLTDKLVEIAIEGNAVDAAVKVAASAINSLGQAAIVTGGSLSALSIILDGANAQTEKWGKQANLAVTDTSAFRYAADLLGSAIDEIAAKFSQGVEFRIGTEEAAKLKGIAEETGRLNTQLNSLTGIMTATMGVTVQWTGTLGPFADALARANAVMGESITAAQAFGSADVNPFANPATMQTINDAIGFKLTAPIIKSTDATKAASAATDEWGRKLDEASIKKRATDLIIGAQEPWQRFSTELKKADADLIAFGATAQQIGAVHQQIAEKYGNTWAQVAPAVAGSFQHIGQSFEKESSGMARFAKIAGIAQATISMLVGAAKALELPFPANLAASAAVLAQGAALVAQVQSIGGFAEGGSFRVMGPGGRDNMRAMVDVSSGEQVDISRPGDVRGQTGGDVRDITVSVQGEVFGQKTIRKLVEQLNEAYGNGARLRFA